MVVIDMPFVEHSRQDDVVTLELNRPDKRNALNPELIASLQDAITTVEQDNTIRVLILGGRGPAFCSGMDLQGVLDDPVAMGGMLQDLARTTLRIRALPIPTIARVHGAAIGGGCGLCAVTDLAISHPEAKLGYPEVTLGVCPAVVAPWLTRKIGAGPARALLLQGGQLSGTEAASKGLVDELVPEPELEMAVTLLAKKLAGGGPDAIAVTKQWLNELDGSIDAAMLDRGAALSAEVIAGEEAQARLRPFFGSH